MIVFLTAIILIKNEIVSISLITVSVIIIALGMILDHQTNIDKKNHELFVKEWSAKKR